MTRENAVERLERALRENSHCSGGLLSSNRAFAMEYGPSGGPEALALLYLDDPSFGFWYGHVLPAQDKKTFVALLVWSTQFVNAPDVPLLFRRFHYWMRVRLEYQPCCVQREDDVYAETASFEDGVNALTRMIRRFDLEKRWGDEGGPYAISPPDYRIIGVYGIEDHRDADGRYPPIPTRTPLTLAGEIQWF